MLIDNKMTIYFVSRQAYLLRRSRSLVYVGHICRLLFPLQLRILPKPVIHFWTFVCKFIIHSLWLAYCYKCLYNDKHDCYNPKIHMVIYYYRTDFLFNKHHVYALHMHMVGILPLISISRSTGGPRCKGWLPSFLLPYWSPAIKHILLNTFCDENTCVNYFIWI